MPFSLPNQMRLPPTSNVLEINKPQGWGGGGGGGGERLTCNSGFTVLLFFVCFCFS